MIAKDPKIVMICDYETSLTDLKENLHLSNADRYDYRVTKLTKYIQVFSHGKHLFIILVFCGDKAEESARVYMKRGRGTLFQKDIFYSELKSGMIEEYDVEITYFECDVPKDLFAEKPDHGIKLLLWNWINLWCTRPKDQCKFRKRALLYAFTIKPPLFILVWLASTVLGTLYTIFGCGILLFLGWRPVSPWMNIKESFLMDHLGDGEFNTSLFYEECDEEWRTWTKKLVNYHGYKRTRIPILLVPWILLLTLSAIGGAGYGIYSLFSTTHVSSFSQDILPIVIRVVIVAGTIYGVLSFLSRYTSDERVRARKRKKEQKEKEWETIKLRVATEENKKVQEFLKTNAGFSSVPEKVEIEKILPVVDTATKFTLHFWQTKAKVCKPYARN